MVCNLRFMGQFINTKMYTSSNAMLDESMNYGAF